MSEDPIGYAGGDTNLYRYVFNSPDNATDPSGEVIFIPFLVMAGKAALTYLATQAAVSAVETTIEAGISSAMGAEFDWGVSFGKNFAINYATGGIGSKGKWLHRAAAYAGRQGIEIAGDTAVDVAYYGNDLGSSIALTTRRTLRATSSSRVSPLAPWRRSTTSSGRTTPPLLTISLTVAR